jgi:hypothetical protein
VSSARRRFAIAGAMLAAAAAAVAVALSAPAPRTVQSSLPGHTRLLLLTSLPLMFNEEFTLEATGSPALRALNSSFDVVPISVADDAELGKGKLLLMAQPFAQPPANLVDLDQWVRTGGRLLLLADPALEWPSRRPLGDLTRPPPMFADTGLLRHWGLRLDPPDERGVMVRRLGRFRIATVSPGRLSGGCAILDDGLAARCRIGSGQAIVIADADFLNVAALGPDGSRNLDALREQLASLANG